MRRVALNTPCPADGQEERLARLTRHLKARLLDFGPGGPEVLSDDQGQGIVTARFPGHATAEVLQKLEQQHGVRVALEGDTARFCLSSQTRFEDLDYVWGCLFDLL